MFLSCGRWQNYHEPTDTPDQLSYIKMACITLYAEALVRSMAATTLKSGRETVTDTAALEIEAIRGVFGPVLPVILRALGIGPLRDRDDLDALAEALLGLGL